MTSAEISALFADAASTSAVDAVAWKQVKAGNVPSYIASSFWKWVTITGGGHTLEILVAPDYFALGTDDDPWRVGRTSENFAQDVADKYGAVLPTWKMLKAIQSASDPHIPYIDVKAHGIGLKDIETAHADNVANAEAKKAFDAAGISPGDHLTIGWAKAFVVAADEDGTHLCIGGGSWDSSGTSYVQTPCSPHVVSYGDASQRIVLVSKKARLDGADVDLVDDVAKSSDPAVYGLIFDGPKFDLTFPNSGKGTVSKMAFGLAQDLGSVLGSDDLSTAAGRTAATRKGAGTILGAVAGAGVWFAMRATPIVGALVTVAGAAVGRLVGGALSRSNPGTGDAPADVPST